MLESDSQTAATAEAADAEAAVDTAAPEDAARPTDEDGRNIDAIFGVKLDVRVVLGRNRMPVSELLNLTKGSVIELDRKVGEPVDVMINARVVARGDLVKVKGDMIGVALREIVKDFVPGI
jgi:flagellar motor switch protein FliN/FliY